MCKTFTVVTPISYSGQTRATSKVYIYIFGGHLLQGMNTEHMHVYSN